MNFDEFLIKMKEIQKKGFIESHRKGDTGIGKTLEDLLGITENNIAGPDFGIFELKSARKRASSMLTLFTKAPQPQGANHELLMRCGYPSRKKTNQSILFTYLGSKETLPQVDSTPNEYELHITVDSTRDNSLGLRLEIKGNVVYIANPKGVQAYYEETYLKEAFQKKYQHSLVYVLADSKKEGGKEFFHFNEAQLLNRFNFERFLSLIRSGEIKLDIRIGHYPDGRPHDHGTGFRTFPMNLPLCFAEVKKIL
jgi:hypothetical protein